MESGVAASSRHEQTAPADRTSTLDLSALTRQLPCSKYDPKAAEARKKMFDTFDTSGDGTLSLLDVQNGLRVVLKDCGTKALDALGPAVSRAFHAAKSARSSKGTKAAQIVSKGEEFRRACLVAPTRKLHATGPLVTRLGSSVRSAARLPEALL